jgi:hypothetical protein
MLKKVYWKRRSAIFGVRTGPDFERQRAGLETGRRTSHTPWRKAKYDFDLDEA